MLQVRQRDAFILLLIFLSVMGADAQAKSAQVANRYLYTLNCNATLEKFDTLSRKKISTSDLTKHSKLIPTHGNQANSVVDGCATDGASYQAKAGTLYTISPTTGSIESGAIRHYRVLSFRLSDLTPAGVINLPGKYDADDGPNLITDLSGQTGVMAHNSYSRIVAGRLISASMPSMPSELPGSHSPSDHNTLYELDLSTYHSSDPQLAGRTDRLAYQPFERSGDTVLIQIPLSKQGWVWVVADAAARSLTPLNLPFHSTDTSVHLAPGGKIILAQEASYGPGRISQTKGSLALIDANTGDVIKTWTDPALDHNYILTITPHGEMVYYGRVPMTFASIDLHSSGTPAVRCHPDSPYFFYADR